MIPFVGTDAELVALMCRAASLVLRDGDSLTIVDNRAAGPPPRDGRVVAACEQQSSYYARNCGVSRGSAEWLVFVDADVVPEPNLLDRYFERPPGERTAVLAGAVTDEPIDPAEDAPWAARYAHLRGRMGQAHTLLRGEWGYAQTANCAIRRRAFEVAGGFRDGIRSAGDADLCFRLRAAGWGIEERPEANAIHRSRRTVPGMLQQRARHGAGVAWLNRQYPGAFPAQNPLGLAKWTLGSFVRAGLALARGRRDAAVIAAVEPLDVWALQLGRVFSNDVGRRQ